MSRMDVVTDDTAQVGGEDTCTIRCTPEYEELTLEPLVRFEIENYLPDSDARIVWDFPVDAAIQLAEMLAQSASAAIEVAGQAREGGD